VTGYEIRPEWYQVVYNLAAQQAHLAIGEDEPRTLWRWLRDVFDDDEEDREGAAARAAYLRKAQASATEVLRQAAETLEIDRVLRSGFRDQISSEQASSSPLSDKLREFLAATVELSAAVLLAGLVRIATDQWPVGEIEGRKDLLEKLDTPIDPDALVDYVLRAKDISYRVHYNLACYFSQSPDDQTDQAWDHFQRALTSAPRLEAAGLADWAGRDPTLKELRVAKGEEFDQFTRLYLLPTYEEQRDESDTTD
jgi:hypothetical protein